MSPDNPHAAVDLTSLVGVFLTPMYGDQSSVFDRIFVALEVRHRSRVVHKEQRAILSSLTYPGEGDVAPVDVRPRICIDDELLSIVRHDFASGNLTHNNTREKLPRLQTGAKLTQSVSPQEAINK